MVSNGLIYQAPPSPLHLVEEIGHRVVNEYSEAISSLTLAAARSGSEQAKLALSAAADRLHAYAESHRALLPPWKEETVNVADYISGICASLSKATLAERGTRLAVQVDEVWAGAERCWRIGLIVAELVRNAARHGLAGREGEITVQLVGMGEQILCWVGDNGGVAAQPRPGRGSRLVRALVAELGGSVEWRFSEMGCTARVELPASPPTIA
jgi:two-component sensor histidine kinase